MARVVIEHLDKFFLSPQKEPIHALRDLNLAVEDKELMVLVGPSGCGKSTLLRTIAGLEEPSAGAIAIDGRAMNHVAAKDRGVAMVFQNYALYPHMTVYENMAFGLKLRKIPKTEIENRVVASAQVLEMKSLFDRLPGAISGGERQRVALGRALVLQPKVLLLDEPLSNLDAALRAQMRVELAKLHTRLETTMIYVTHDQVEAITLGQRIAVMKEGAIQQVAEPMELYAQPANLFVAGFIGSPRMNFFHGSIRRQGERLHFEGKSNKATTGSGGFDIRLPDGLKPRLERFAGREILLGIRPEDIAVNPPDSGAGTRVPDTEPAAQATVEVIEPRGPETFLHLKTGREEFTVRVRPDFRTKVWEIVFFNFDLGKAHFFDPDTGKAVK